jgi:hypothetical protein
MIGADYLDAVMEAVNERLLAEIERDAVALAIKLTAAGQENDDINTELRAMLPEWNTRRAQAYRSIRQSISEMIEATVERYREQTVVH